MIDLRSLSYEEKEAIEELRMRVEKELDPVMLQEETIYYRFLKARDFNIEKAEKMLRKNIVWRKAKQVNTLLEDFVPKEVYLKFLQLSYFGTDNKGDLIAYLAAGKLDTRDMMQCMQLNDFVDHLVQYTEGIIRKCINIAKRQENAKKTYPQMLIIYDLDELTFSNATSKAALDIMLAIFRTMSDHYPETLSSIYVINAPHYYLIPFSILKTVMSNAMIQKISVFDKDGWKEALLECIDADILPAFLGGNRTDPDGDPLCKTFVTHGHIPLEYYSLSDEERYFKDKTQIQKVCVPKNSKKEVDVDVTEEGSVIQLEFLVKNKDIGIGLFHRDLEIIDVLPVLRYCTVDGTTTISYKTKTAGKYMFVFDNSYSWMHSKEVEYTLKVLQQGN